MASPQLENGYTRIANELLEALVLSDFPGAEMSICLLVLRKTYGFKKKEDAISLSQFVESLSYSRQGIIFALQSLKNKNVLLVKQGFRGTNIWRFNKDYMKWIVKSTILDKYTRLVKPTITTSTVHYTPLVKPTLHTKDIPKENIQKKENSEKIKLKLNSIREELKQKGLLHK